jgi:hypothetical protein
MKLHSIPADITYSYIIIIYLYDFISIDECFNSERSSTVKLYEIVFWVSSGHFWSFLDPEPKVGTESLFSYFATLKGECHESKN